MTTSVNTSAVKTTSYKVILPFYLYAAIAFLAAAILLFISSDAFLQEYFHPHILAITHIVALGWGTMIILGASHQLVPVLVEGSLYSHKLAYTTFIFAALGIPLLACGFYTFDMGDPAKWGGRFVVLAILSYLINLGISIFKSKNKNMHAIYVFTAVIWLFVTTFLGLALVYNFTYKIMPHESLYYLPLHVHTGVIGWFLLLIIGVASRLIPMFLISKYTNIRLLQMIYFLINFALISYIFLFYFIPIKIMIFIPAAALLVGIISFVYYCYQAFKQRIRRQVDKQLKLSLLAAGMLILPIILLIILLSLFGSSGEENNVLVVAYGFLIFFGWLTALILGMTFKTLPFIVWNKIYGHRAAIGKTPNPKDMFSDTVFKIMGISYLLGFIVFLSGLLSAELILLRVGGMLLLITAILYNFNVLKIVYHKPG